MEISPVRLLIYQIPPPGPQYWPLVFCIKSSTNHLLYSQYCPSASVFVLFCWMEALSVCSDHRRAMRCRTREGTVVLGEMDVARVNPYRYGQGQPPSALDPVSAPPANGDHPIPGAIRDLPLTRWTTSTRPGLRKASGRGMTFGED